MQAPDPVEAILARLMPPGLSGSGQAAVESMIDELAGPPSPAVAATALATVSDRGAIRRRAGWLCGIAAGVAAALLVPLHPGRKSMAGVGSPSPSLAPADFVLVGGSGRIESMTEDGWHEDADGSTMQATRLSVVEEENLIDEETGILMTVSEPREEILLMPVSAF